MATDLPEPHCPIGYPEDQLRELLGSEQLDAFIAWMYGQTLGICAGEHSGESHGRGYYRVDVQRFMRSQTSKGAALREGLTNALYAPIPDAIRSHHVLEDGTSGGWHHHAGPHACDWGNHDDQCPWEAEHPEGERSGL